MEWAKGRPRISVLLEMRLGKCPVAINWVYSHGFRSTLIVAPISTFDGWRYWAERFGMPLHLLEGTREKRYDTLLAGLSEGGLFLVNPQGLFLPAKTSKRKDAIPSDIATYKFDANIWDETTEGLCSPDTQVNWIANRYLCAEHKCILTGDIRPQSALQVFEPMKWCYGSFMGQTNYYHWQLENFRQWGFKWMPKDIGKIRQAAHSLSYVLSQKAAGVAPDWYPEKRICILPPRVREEYDALTRDFALNLRGMGECKPCGGTGWRKHGEGWEECTYCGGEGELNRLEANTAIVVRRWKRQIAGGFPPLFPHLYSEHKLKVLQEVLGETSRRAVVTFVHNTELEECAKKIKGAVKLHGQMSPIHRRQIETEFRRKDGPRVLLAQVKCVCYGMNLSSADWMIRYSLPDRYLEISQSLQRINDLANPRPLYVTDLVCRDTVDEDLVDAAVNHGGNSRAFMKRLVTV